MSTLFAISCHMIFKIAYFGDLSTDYQPEKYQYCRLSVVSFIDGLRKQNDDVIMTSFYVVWI